MVIILFCSNVCAAQTQTVYYKMIKKMVGEAISTSVSGGQFITFSDKSFYESDIDGFSVGHGKLEFRYSKNGVITYVGNSYWGKSIFKFTSNKDMLNVIAGDVVYVYKKASAPTGTKTCSLIRNESRGNYIPNITDYPASYDSEQSLNPYKGHYETKTERCINCSGKGYNMKYIWHGGDKSSTVQQRCSYCHGTGTVTKREYVLDE